MRGKEVHIRELVGRNPRRKVEKGESGGGVEMSCGKVVQGKKERLRGDGQLL